jgi:ATP-dependent DNA helicase RecG
MNYDNLVIENLIARGENERVAFFQQFDWEEIGQTICAFANEEGGDILIGFNENRDPVKLNTTVDPKELNFWLYQNLKPQVPVSMRQLKYKNKIIIHISVWPGANKPYSFNGEIFVRDYSSTTTTTTTEPADSEDLSQLIGERKSNEFLWERQTVLGAEISDLDLYEVKETIKEFIKNKPSVKELSVEDFLTQTGLIRGGSLTNAAIILFAVNPSHYLPQCKMRITVYPEDKPGNTFVYDKQFEGNLFRNIYSAWDFFENYLTSWSRIEGLKRGKDKLPIFALREGLLNALVHRDYSLSMNYLNISLYADRLEISNPGELPEGINLSDLKKKHPSVLRNPDIAQICFIRGYIEMLGTGTLRMIDDCISNGFREPEWKVGNNRTFLVFPDIKNKLTNKGVNEGVNEGVNLIVEGINEGVKQELQQLLKFIKNTPGKKTPDFVSYMNKGTSTIERYVKILKDSKLIEFKGAPKTGGYYIIEK